MPLHRLFTIGALERSLVRITGHAQKIIKIVAHWIPEDHGLADVRLVAQGAHINPRDSRLAR